MSNTNLLGSEEWAVVAKIDPASNGANTYYTAPDIDMTLFEQLMAIITIGASTVAVVDFTFVSGAAATPTTTVANKAITQLGGSPTGGNDGDVFIVNLRGDELTEGHRYVRGKLVVATAASISTVIILGKAKSLPASDNDDPDVTEIVA
jgi:hypothetical protein